MTDYTDLVDRLRVSRFKDSTAAEYDINGVEAERLQAADAIEALQRENALLRGVADGYRTVGLIRDGAREIQEQDWGLSTLQQMQAEIGNCKHEWVSARNDVVESGIVCVKCNAVKAESDFVRYYPDSIGGEVTPLGNQANGDEGFT